jgi:hypothetical protein
MQPARDPPADRSGAGKLIRIGLACAENLIRPGEQLSGFGGGRMSWLLSESPPAAA